MFSYHWLNNAAASEKRRCPAGFSDCREECIYLHYEEVGAFKALYYNI